MSYIYFITPVGSDPQYQLKRELLAQISKNTGREFFFPLERHSSFTLDTARADLCNASLVIADLSLERPSCYFELGIAQALGVPVCIIAVLGTTLHQMAIPNSALLYPDLGQYSEIINQAVTTACQQEEILK